MREPCGHPLEAHPRVLCRGASASLLPKAQLPLGRTLSDERTRGQCRRSSFWGRFEARARQRGSIRRWKSVPRCSACAQMLPLSISSALRAPSLAFVTRRTAGPPGSRAAGTNSSRRDGRVRSEKENSTLQSKRAQSLRLMTAGLVSLAGAFIIMRAQAVGASKRSLEQQGAGNRLSHDHDSCTDGAQR